MKVTLVATVRDAAAELPQFLASVAAQTRPPDEVVIVDGGSHDGSVEILRNAGGVVLIEEPGANIARGRNLAIAAATHDAIAVSDADCVLDPAWLERLTAALEAGADVAMGTYRAVVRGLWEACAAAVSVPEASEVREDRFMPSARSVAFRREAFEAAGGYPEWLDIGEDMYLDHRWRQAGARMVLVREAVVGWRPRPRPVQHWRQYSGYARGDALAGMFARRHAVRFAVYAGLAAVVASRRRRALIPAALAGAAYAAAPVRRAIRLAEGPGERAAAALLTPAVLGFTDLAKMAGYLRGLANRTRHLEVARA